MPDPNGGIFSKIVGGAVAVVTVPYYWLKKVFGGKDKQ